MTADDLRPDLDAHADSLDARITRHAGNDSVLAQIARSTPDSATGTRRRSSYPQGEAMSTDTTDRYNDDISATPQFDDRERVARALFVRRGFRAEEWNSNHPATIGLRRDCRYLAEAAIDAMTAEVGTA